MVGVIDILQRTVEILDRKMTKNPALPRKKVDHMNINNVVSAISAVVDAASLFSSDTKRHVLLTEMSRKMTTEILAHPWRQSARVALSTF